MAIGDSDAKALGLQVFHQALGGQESRTQAQGRPAQPASEHAHGSRQAKTKATGESFARMRQALEAAGVDLGESEGRLSGLGHL